MNKGLGACKLVGKGPRGPSIPIIISFQQECSIPTQVSVLALVLRYTFTLAYMVEASEDPAYLVVNHISTSLMQCIAYHFRSSKTRSRSKRTSPASPFACCALGIPLSLSLSRQGSGRDSLSDQT